MLKKLIIKSGLDKVIVKGVDKILDKNHEVALKNMEKSIKRAEQAEANGNTLLANANYNLAARDARTLGLKETARELLEGREEMKIEEIIKVARESAVQERKDQILHVLHMGPK